ncbi:hypothetical protein J1G42_16830 [Cellulomonas sp. zg-ZUI222]|uniref:hypothetical protein n=1 Tax=Cellulomonas wangleii TaxID=2816956 RepID=UPI001A94C4A5|nr:hypothetical protein [Cellulomonas wangleii]MBO0922488.1 hypothetical protein [Cellulomonas wangleii]
MSVIIAAMRQSDGDGSSTQATLDVLRRIGERCDGFLSGPTRRRAHLSRLATGSPWHLLRWDAPALPVDEAALNGFEVVSTGQAPASAELAGALRLEAGRPRLCAPVWGSYVTYVGRPHTGVLMSWATTPSPQSVHWASAGDWTFVSSSALACAIAAAEVEGRELALSRVYLREYLAFGFGMSEVSPFRGVHNLATGDALAVHRGRITTFPKPSARVALLGDEDDPHAAGIRLADAVESATRRGLSRAGSNVVARVSGGKDSRVILAALTNVGARVSCRVYGIEGDPDVTLARRITGLVGAPLDVAAPPLADSGGVRRSGLQVLRDAGGVPPSEAHLLPFGLSDGESEDVTLTMGHWPLYKGGMAKKMKYGPGGVQAALYRKCSPYAGDALTAASRESIDAWAGSAIVGTELELLYQWALDFRSGRYLESHHTHYSSVTNLVYPLIDAEVAEVCNQMTMFTKVSELALFHAMMELNRDFALLPLDRGDWRFASNALYADLLSERRSAVASAVRLATDVAAPRERRSDTLIEVARETAASDTWSEIADLLSPPFAAAVQAFADGERVGAEYFQDMASAKALWRAYAATLWLSGDWLASPGRAG